MLIVSTACMEMVSYSDCSSFHDLGMRLNPSVRRCSHINSLKKTRASSQNVGKLSFRIKVGFREPFFVVT